MAADDARVTPPDELQQLAAPYLVTVPGWRPGTKITVRLQPVDPLALAMQARAANPVLARIRQGQAADPGATPEAETTEMTDAGLEILRATVRAALVEPTYDELEALRPLTSEMLFGLADHIMGDSLREDLAALAPFRGQ